MDTRAGQIVNLDQIEAEIAEIQWQAWKAGLLEEMPKYAPFTGDKVAVKSPAGKPKPKKQRRTKATRSYKDFCR